MDIEQIISSFEEKINIIKLKKIDVIFSKLNPDQNDIIQLTQISDSLREFQADETENLLKFFNTFSKQTGKSQMSRKYFYMNMMAAAQQNKFNINKMLYDEDINEIQRSLQNIRMKNRQSNSQMQQLSSNSSVQQSHFQSKEQSTCQRQDKIQSNKSEELINFQLQPNYSSSQLTSLVTSTPYQNSQSNSEVTNISQTINGNYCNIMTTCNQISNASINMGYNTNNLSQVQTTNISYIKNDENQIIPHIEVSLKNAMSTPMIPDHGVKDQYLNSQESSAQKTNFLTREGQFSASKNINNSFLGPNGTHQTNNFSTISVIQGNCQGDSLFMSQEDQENLKSLMNKRQDIRLLKSSSNSQSSQQSAQKTHFLKPKQNKVSQSIDRSNSKQNMPNDSFILRESTNSSNIQHLNNIQGNRINKQGSQNTEQKKSPFQQSLYEQILKSKKAEQMKNQLPPTHPMNLQPGIVPSSSYMHQDKLIKIISRDKIIKDFKENFRGKENFCDDFMELDSTIRRLEKTNQSPVNSQILKTLLHEGTTNYDSVTLNKYSSNNNNCSATPSVSNTHFFSNNNNNNNNNNNTFYQNNNHSQLEVNNNATNLSSALDNKSYTPKVLKNSGVQNQKQSRNSKFQNEETSNKKVSGVKRGSSQTALSKSSSKENCQHKEGQYATRNSVDSNSGIKRVTRSVSTNAINKSRNSNSKSPSQEKIKSQKPTISRKISNELLPNNQRERSTSNQRERSTSNQRERSTSNQRFEEKQPINFLEFKQKQQLISYQQQVQKREFKKENSLEKINHPKMHPLTPMSKQIATKQEITTNSSFIHPQSYQEQNNNQFVEASPITQNKAITPKIKESNALRIKKPAGYQEQFNKKKQQQIQRSSRNHSVSVGQGMSQESSVCGNKKVEDQEESQQNGVDVVKIPKFLLQDANTPSDHNHIVESFKQEKQQPLESKRPEKQNQMIPPSPTYIQYFEQIIMQDEKISKYFTTQNDDEGSQFGNQQYLHNQSQGDGGHGKKSSHTSSRITDTSTLREQKFEALEGATLEQAASCELGENSHQHSRQNKHETIYQLMIQEDKFNSPSNEEQIQQQNTIIPHLDEMSQQEQDQKAPQFGGYNNNYHSDSHQDSTQQKSYLDSPQQFLDVLKTKMEEDQDNEFLQIQMENLKKIQQEKQKLMQEEAEMLQQLKKSQMSKGSQRNSLYNSIQSILSVSKSQQLQPSTPQAPPVYNLRSSLDKNSSPGLPLPQKQNQSQQQQQQQFGQISLSQQQQQLRSSYYQNNNHSSNRSNSVSAQQYNNQDNNNNNSIRQNSSINNQCGGEYYDYNSSKELHQVQNQNSNYNSSSSQRDAQGSIDSGYNYASNAAQKYSFNQISQNQQNQVQQNQIESQGACFAKQLIGSSQNLVSIPQSSYPNNQNSSLNFSFTDS